MTTSPINPDEPVPPEALVALLDTMSEGVVIVDPGGVIRYWNLGAEQIFGHSRAAALGQRLDVIIPDHLRNRHWEAFDAAVSTGSSRYSAGDLLAVPAITADGRRISIEFTVTFLAGDTGIAWIAAAIRDVTARWAETRGLRERIAQMGAAAPEQAP